MNRNTVQLNLTRAALISAGKHATADEVYLALSRQHPQISKSTVYNNLAKLAERGEVTLLQNLDTAARYDINTAPHYHFKCEKCGSVCDVDLPYMQNITAGIKTPDLKITNHEILFHGLCPACNR